VVTANDLLVISDEVWADLVHLGAAHRPVAMVPGLAERSVTVSSASKSFNLAGLRCAVAHIGSDRVMEEFDRHPARLRGHVNTLAAEATLACWREGGPWLDALRTHLIEQFAHLDSRLRNELPGVIWQPPEATYLAWLDGRGLGLDDEFSSVVLDEGRVALSHGVEFGSTGAGFARMNVATSRPILDEVLDRMVAVLG
jgi:cystathionine beta-lyase